ncbi:MAG: hypothetical protein KDA61_11940, partial [Planctomycetales bacterium]|nr:hypothetical protein [Planctomycetales bacterium]
MRQRAFTCISACLLLGANVAPLVSAESITLHVSSGGDVSGDGAQASPFGSLADAQRRVRQLVAAGSATSIRVEISAGDYLLDAPWTLTAEDASPACPVAYVGVDDVREDSARRGVVISGGMSAGAWSEEAARWEATLPSLDATNASQPNSSALRIRDLWVGGRRATRCRAPNDGYFRIAAAGPDRRTSFSVEPGDLLDLAHPDEAEAVYLHDWSISRAPLESIDASALSYKTTANIGGDMPQFAIGSFEPHARYFIEGALETLDAPGEWHADRSSRKLLYIPREDDDPRLAAVVPRLDQLLVVRGDDRGAASHLTFENLTFRYSRFELPPFGYAGIQSNWYERRQTRDDFAGISMRAAVELDR